MQISHLSFANDIIIFTNEGIIGLRKLIDFLTRYENCSDQKINRSKSTYYVSSWVSNGRVDQINRLIGIHKQDPPFIYLGCPIYVGRKRIASFKNLVDKIFAGFAGWQHRLLNIGGRLILIKHILSSIPMNILSAISLPK